MNCIEAREAMLVAEPSVLGDAALNVADALDGPGDSFAEHLAACHACRRIAGRLAADLNGLSFRVRARSRRRRNIALAALPIAAVLVATVAVGARRSPASAPSIEPRADHPAKVVSVDVGVGQRAAVIKTADPKTTLVWISTGTN